MATSAVQIYRMLELLDRSLGEFPTHFALTADGNPRGAMPRAAMLQVDGFLPVFAIDALDSYSDSGLARHLGPLGVELDPSPTAILGVRCRFDDSANPGLVAVFLRESLSRQIRMLTQLHSNATGPVPVMPLIELFQDQLSRISAIRDIVGATAARTTTAFQNP